MAMLHIWSWGVVYSQRQLFGKAKRLAKVMIVVFLTMVPAPVRRKVGNCSSRLG